MMGLKREEIITMSKKWNVLYPAYINSTLSESDGLISKTYKNKKKYFYKNKTKKGRKIGKKSCIDNPSVNEMSEVLTYLKLPHVVEVDKTYCKDILNNGRIRVLLKNENGQFISNIKRSKIMMIN